MRALLVVIFSSFAIPLVGCGNGDCTTYCDYRRECIDDDLDFDDCVDDCSDASDKDQDHAEKAAECAECVSTRTCAEARDSCLDDCWGVEH